ncbi:MAG: ATP-binding cassette domain-containing protein, partial [Acidimicrobiales bacterium]|nr:ATP-binding cassette domain-containing protein [Acidimicrobiales bacterium]
MSTGQDPRGGPPSHELRRESAARRPEQSAVDLGVAALDPDGERPHDLLHSEHLTLRIGPSTILKDIEIEFPSGSITAVIGPTGTGKSMFLRTLNRMNDQLSGFARDGDVTLDGT